jgi:hypothetical protein
MSVFGSIVSAIFGSKHAAGVTAAAGSPSPPPSSPATSVIRRDGRRRNRDKTDLES